MSKLKWDAIGEHLFETGVNQCALYLLDPQTNTYPEGVAWNGVTAITEKPSGADANALYADNKKYLNLIATEEFGATIEAYTYPDEWMECDGQSDVLTGGGMAIGQQKRSIFGLAFKTLIGNDTNGTDHGYKIHLIYGATASVAERGYETVNDSPDAITFSWDIETVPVEVGFGNFKPTSSIVIDSTKFTTTALQGKLKDLEDKLFGTDGTGSGTGTTPYLPLPAEVYTTLGGSTNG